MLARPARAGPLQGGRRPRKHDSGGFMLSRPRRPRPKDKQRLAAKAWHPTFTFLNWMPRGKPISFACAVRACVIFLRAERIFNPQ